MNINQLMKQAQQMQAKMSEMQKESENKVFEGKAGGGLVLVTMTGSGKMQKVSIDTSLINENEKEMLEDLIVAAYNDAKFKADEDSKTNMTNAFGNMGGIPGLNL